MTSPVMIPRPLHDILNGMTRIRHGALNSAPLADGVDEAIFYLDRATQWHQRRHAAQSSYAVKIANIIRAHWLLEVIQQGDEYKNAVGTIYYREVRRQLDNYGMSLPQFIGQLLKVGAQNSGRP